jgi:hypothetical protein
MATNNATDYVPVQHDVILGAASGGITSLAPSATSGVPLISQGSSSDPTFGTAVVAGGGTGSTSFTAYGPVLAGATTTTALSSIAPSATSGVPIISQGSSAQPAFGTAVVAGGGTGVATMTTAYAPVCAGTTATGALQVASTGLTTSGYILTSNGGSALPSFQVNAGASGFTVVNIQSFTASGTYTPTASMKYCIVYCQAPGGGGGGGDGDGANQKVGAGGGAGGYDFNKFSAATIGASQTVTIGAVGAGGIGNNSGGTGGTTSLGALISCTGGTGGANGNSTSSIAGGTGGVGTSGVLSMTAGSAEAIPTSPKMTGAGASSFFGDGAPGKFITSGPINGNSATVYGAGGSGAVSGATEASATGGAGAAGVIIITEFI